MTRPFAISVALATLAATPAAGQAPMRILVSNDDGVRSEGIAALVEALRPLGEVVVSAPAENNSGGSQSVTLFSKPLEVETLDSAGATARYAVRGTPADSVIFGLLGPGKEKPFDLVVSGINKGENVGDAVPVSGTVGAARQAAMMGVPAIAVSQQFTRDGKYDFALAARYAAQIAAKIHALGDRAPRLVSINVPTNPKGVRFIEAGGSAFGMNALRKLPGGDNPAVARYGVDFAPSASPSGNGDAAALAAGWVTVTALSLDPNDRATTRRLCGQMRRAPSAVADKALRALVCPR